MGHDMHQIGEAAAQTGLSLRTIRFYEEVGLVPPSGRTAGGFRLYTDADIERLQLVKDLKPLDFSLEEMGEVLALQDQLDAGGAGGDEAQLRSRLDGFAEIAEQRCEELRARLRAAEAVAKRLRRESGRS
ncbi:MerR family transcriptional regulator [Acidimicrobiia bacterium EGI L10123]|uniref:MerR family transcriptional regulator n=1 Tax=Salinilacustrithrix flava TaxID=2957203 RepID=UPI003D7C23F5|nr:MerR family transcriptional regulator [Acidimicrobiia bacterium EGI L10123]